jgi:hypothetical protein
MEGKTMKITLKELKSLIKEAVYENKRYRELKRREFELSPEEQEELDALHSQLWDDEEGEEAKLRRDFPEFDFGDEPVRHPDADRERLRRR